MNDKHPRWLALYVLCLGDLMIVLATNMSACSPFTVNEGAGWVGIDLCGTPLIPSDARGSTDVDVVQAQLVQEAVRAPDTGGPPVPRSSCERSLPGASASRRAAFLDPER